MINETYLITRLKNGDQQAFRQVFELYVNKVYQFVYGYVKERTEAEDIVQNVFHKVWVKRDTIDADKSFSGFLFTIAYRKIVDHIRQHTQKKKHAIVRFLHHEEPFSNTSADHLLIDHELASQYERALNTLTPKRKEIFLLSRHLGLSNKEIAEKLQLSVKTVENHMTAALFTLKEFLRKAEIGVVALCITSLL